MALLAIPFLAASPAYADGPPNVNIDGVHKPLGTVNIILIFVLIPLALTAILMLIFLRPSTAPGAQRYRPGRGWDAKPAWFGIESRTELNRPALPPSPEGPLVGDVLEPGAVADPDPGRAGSDRRAPSPTGVGGARGSW
jgi:hypothetical protein